MTIHHTTERPESHKGEPAMTSTFKPWPAGTVDQLPGLLGLTFQDWQLDILRDWEEKSQPTMADVDWNPAEHRFAEVETPDGVKWIMLAEIRRNGAPGSKIIASSDESTAWLFLPKELTLTGRKFQLAPGDGWVEEDQRIIAWHAIAEHPFFKDCFGQDKPLLDSMIDKLNQIIEAKEKPARSKRRWTGLEDQILRESLNVPNEDLAERLERSPEAIRRRKRDLVEGKA